jgi:hypothetical protein
MKKIHQYRLNQQRQFVKYVIKVIQQVPLTFKVNGCARIDADLMKMEQVCNIMYNYTVVKEPG